MLKSFLAPLAIILFLLAFPADAQMYIDPGFGAVFKDANGNMTPRLNMGVHNLLFNRVGVYGTLEIVRTPGAKLFKETDERDIAGGIVRINDFLSVYAGTGMVSNGLLSNGFSLKGVRKEAGVEFNIPEANLNIDLGFSTSSGISANIGYIIPFGKSSKKSSTPVSKSPIVQKPAVEPIQKAPVVEEPKKPEPAQQPIVREVEKVEEVTKEPEPETITPVQPKPAPANAVAPAADSENLTPGIYAVNGVFRYRRNAVDELNKMKKAGFTDARIGFKASSGLYYIWLLHSSDDQVIKDYVWKSRDSGRLKTVWLLRVN